MASLLVTFDLKHQGDVIEKSIEDIANTSISSANEIAWRASKQDAELLINGLSNHIFIVSASISTEYGEVLSEYTAPSSSELTAENKFLSLFVERYQEKSYSLNRSVQGDRRNVGNLLLLIDNHLALEGLYKRTVTIFTLSLLSFAALTLALGFIYHFKLTRPLTALAKYFNKIDTKTLKSQFLPNGHHCESEFSLIIDSANAMLKEITAGQTLVNEQNQRLRLILDTADTIIFAINQSNKIIFANNSTSTFLGKSNEAIRHHCIDDLILPVDEHLFKMIQAFVKSEASRTEQTSETKNANSQKRTLQISLVKFLNDGEQNVLVTALDVTEKVRAEAKVEQLAYFDVLTGLPNRNNVIELLETEFVHPNEIGIALLADIDNFRRINESVGHQTGDGIIKHIALNLIGSFHHEATIARINADEFFCVFKQTFDDDAVAQKQAIILAEKVRKCIAHPITVQDITYTLTASLGVVCFDRYSDGDIIIQHAETAMHEAKRQGKNRIMLFQGAMVARAVSVLELEHKIKHAIENDEFFFMLQPIFCGLTRQIKSAEVLIRWQHKDRIVPPTDFIPFLEESNLIIEVGDKLLHQVFKFLKTLIASGNLPTDFVLAINLSVKQIARIDFVDSIKSLLKKYGVCGELIEFEITEGAAIENKKDTIEKIKQLGDVGIRFSIDDFGTGYSSLSYLQDLPIRKLKIDRSFISGIENNLQSKNLVRAIIQLSQNLELDVVAEGVETAEQANWLTKNGSVLMQGYYFERPLPIDKFKSQYCLKRTTAQQAL
ncbi:MAG: EAL domain-containing protein [Pseudomonadota bacterium]